MRKLSKLIILFVNSLFLLSFFCYKSIYAEKIDFEINTETNIYYEDKNLESVLIEEIIYEKNNNREYYYPKGTEISFYLEYSAYIPDEKDLIKNSLQVFIQNGNNSSYGTKQAVNNYKIEELADEESFLIKVPLTKDFNYKDNIKISVTYQGKSLIKKTGNITKVMIPTITLLDSDSYQKIIKDESSNTTYSYSYLCRILVKKEIGEPDEVSSEKISISEDELYRIFSVADEDLFSESNYFIQFGTVQYAKLKINYDVKRTNFTENEKIAELFPFLTTNLYYFVLPKSDESLVKELKYTKIDPSAKKEVSTIDGGKYLKFNLNSNKEAKIEIEAVIKLQNDQDEFSSISNLSLEEYFSKVANDPNLSFYTQGNAEYWQTNHEKIINLSNEIKGDINEITFEQFLNRYYDYVLKNLTYSMEKAEGTIENERKGAYAVLFEDAPAVCMEYSDVLATLLKVQGIPTRSVVGYILEESELSYDKDGKQVPHEWIEVWVPDYGWLTVDPTFGIGNVRAIGPQIDRVSLYSFAQHSEDYIYSLRALSADKEFEYGDYNIEIMAINEDEYNKNLANATDVIDDFEKIESTQYYGDWGDYFEILFLTFPLGRTVLAVLFKSCPFCIIFLIIINLSITIKRRKRQYSKS